MLEHMDLITGGSEGVFFQDVREDRYFQKIGIDIVVFKGNKILDTIDIKTIKNLFKLRKIKVILSNHYFDTGETKDGWGLYTQAHSIAFVDIDYRMMYKIEMSDISKKLKDREFELVEYQDGTERITQYAEIKLDDIPHTTYDLGGNWLF